MPSPTVSSLVYKGSSGDVPLDGPLVYVGTGLGIRGRAWSYTLGRADISSQLLGAREATLSASFLDLEEADRARLVFDRDIADGTPGALVSGEWSQRAYVTKSSPQSRYQGYLTSELTVVLLDGAWHRDETFEFMPSSLDSDVGKAYSYGYPYGYAPPSPARTLAVPGSMPNPFRLVVWGRAVNPSITIDGNVYAYDVTVPSGGHLLVDTLYEPIVEIVTADGIRSDAFRSADRGEGKGSGTYAFEPLMPGAHMVAWDDAFGFSLTVHHLESEIPWK